MAQNKSPRGASPIEEMPPEEAAPLLDHPYVRSSVRPADQPHAYANNVAATDVEDSNSNSNCSRMPAWATVLIVVLVVLTIGGVVAVVLYFTVFTEDVGNRGRNVGVASAASPSQSLRSDGDPAPISAEQRSQENPASRADEPAKKEKASRHPSANRRLTAHHLQLDQLPTQDVDKVSEVVYTENVDIFLSPADLWTSSTPNPKDLPKFTAEMQILSSCYDLSVEAQRKKARAQYDAKGFAYFVPAGLNARHTAAAQNNIANTNPLNLPTTNLSKGHEQLGPPPRDYRNLSMQELGRLAGSDQWVHWLKEEVIKKGGLTVLPKDGDGGHDVEWLSETSPAAQVWNSHWSNSDRLLSGNTARENYPMSYGWAGAATGSCSPDLSKSNPFKFYSKCPAGLWDGVSDKAKKREHLKQLFVFLASRDLQGFAAQISLLRRERSLMNNANAQNKGSHDRAHFVFNVGARDAATDNGAPGVAPPLKVVHADGTLENTVSRLRHQTQQPGDFPTPNLNYGTGMSLLGYFNALQSVGVFQGAWQALFAEDKVRKRVGEEICGLESDDFAYVEDHFRGSDLPLVLERGGKIADFVQYAIFLQKLHELEVKDALAKKGGQTQAAKNVGEPSLGFFERWFFSTSKGSVRAREKKMLDEMKEAVQKIVREKLVPLWYRGQRIRALSLLAQVLGPRVMAEILQHIERFMSPEKMEQWGCFFGRLRVHDAYNVWINLTPADEDRATPDLPAQLKNPMAVLDPFTMLPNQSKAHSIAFPNEKHWSEGGEEATRKKNKWYVRPAMYFGEALWFNTNVSYHTAVKNMDYMGNKRKSIESRVIVVDTCVAPAPLGGQGRLAGGKFSLAELKKQCWGKDV